MSYLALALDLDGTTLTSAHTIMPAVKEGIMRVKKQATVILVTGRHHSAAYPYHYELGLTTPIICCNGTYVYDYGQRAVLTDNAIPHEQARHFIALAQTFSLRLVMYVTERMVYTARYPVRYMEALQQWAAGFPAPVQPQIACIPSLEEELANSTHVWKFVAEGELAAIDAFSNHPWVREHFSGEQSWSSRVDFARKGNNKGARLQEYLEQHGISPTQLVAIGDNHNDISMLSLAGMGIAMANAEPQVKQIARQVTRESNDGRGILDVLNTCFPI
ncbi:Cof-type HAD-IIB family hydrolase [Enterobacteriaceae bacterium 4M9]|nr:Cof-type HAD-IIB family hydrolase [Enterobacteriaceae bacterium 4M9]